MIPGTVDAELHDDYLTVTGTTDPQGIARFLEAERPDSFAWEDSGPNKRYARSLTSHGGILLGYGRRNRDGLNAPQSDTRDSDDWMLQVPGHHARDLAPLLLSHPMSGTMQASRRDVAFTFRPVDPANAYRCVSELIERFIRRRAHRIGPDGPVDGWEAVTLQTHEKPSQAPQFLILYDKHAESPAEYPQPGTLRLEARFMPEKKERKQQLLRATPGELFRSWRLSRHALELLLTKPLERSFQWHRPTPDDDLDKLTQALLHSYGPTLRRGLARSGAAYLEVVALAALLQANHPRQAESESDAPVLSPEASAS